MNPALWTAKGEAKPKPTGNTRFKTKRKNVQYVSAEIDRKLGLKAPKRGWLLAYFAPASKQKTSKDNNSPKQWLRTLKGPNFCG